MNIKTSLLVLSIVAAFFVGCSSDDGSSDIQEETAIQLSDLSKGEGAVSISGTETLTIEGAVTSTGSTSAINGSSYFFRTISIGGASISTPSVTFYILIPESLGGTIPSNGTIPIDSQLAGREETYASISVFADDAYSSLDNTTGSVTITNSSEIDLSFDAEFEIQNITSFDDGVVNVQGAFRF